MLIPRQAHQDGLAFVENHLSSSGLKELFVLRRGPLETAFPSSLRRVRHSSSSPLAIDA